MNAAVPTVMVMQEMPPPRQTLRPQAQGRTTRRATPVPPGVPACLPPMPEGTADNRLGLAQWLTTPTPADRPRRRQPILAVVFGVGLVRPRGLRPQATAEPSRVARLAGDGLRRNRVGREARCERIVTSATYRQSSTVTPATDQRDPENRCSPADRVAVGRGHSRQRPGRQRAARRPDRRPQRQALPAAGAVGGRRLDGGRVRVPIMAESSIAAACTRSGNEPCPGPSDDASMRPIASRAPDLAAITNTPLQAWP